MSLVAVTGQNIEVILTLLDGIEQQLGLNEIRQQIYGIPLRDDWERKVASGLQDDLQHIAGKCLKKTLTAQVAQLDFFERQIDQRQIKQYKFMRTEIIDGRPIHLLPYAALASQLGNLFQ
jgi:hypothetical protein